MKRSVLLVKAILLFTSIGGLLAYSHSSNVLYCARPFSEGPGKCELGIDDNKTTATPHYVYLATENECSHACNDTTTIRSIRFKPFK